MIFTVKHYNIRHLLRSIPSVLTLCLLLSACNSLSDRDAVASSPDPLPQDTTVVTTERSDTQASSDQTTQTEQTDEPDEPVKVITSYRTEKLLDYRYTESAGDNVQGTAIYENYMIQLCHSGRARIYDLTAEDPGKPLATFALGSFTGTKTGASANHGNQCMFGAQKWEESDPLPLLYVTTGNAGEDSPDGKGYYARCAVERITVDASGKWSAQLVQVISMCDTAYRPIDSRKGLTVGEDGVKRFLYSSNDTFQNSEGYQVVTWGWPAFFVDMSPTETTDGKLYIHSARFRTTESAETSNMAKYGIPEYGQSNAYIITGFPLPELPTYLPPSNQYALEHPVILTPADIVSQFETDFDIYFTQGGTLYQGRLYYSFGAGGMKEKSYDAIRVYDIEHEQQVGALDLRDAPFANDEPECCCFYQGQLALSTQKKQLYVFELFSQENPRG